MPTTMKRTLLQIIAISVIILLALAWTPADRAAADAEGPRYPGTGIDIAGSGSQAWANPAYIGSDDNQYAVASYVLYGGTYFTDTLMGSNFGFTIPSDAVINGIEVTVGRYSSGTSAPRMRDYIVRLVKGGVISGENKADLATDWPLTEEAATYGGPADLWGTTWTPAEINAADFGLALSAINANTNYGLYRTPVVDYMRITVTYINSTSLAIEPSVVVYGEAASLSATLTPAVSGLSVEFTLNGEPACSAATDAGGVAACTTSAVLQNAGVYPTGVGASFAGNSSYGASSGSASLTVNPKPITVTAATDTKMYDGSASSSGTPTITAGMLTGGDTAAWTQAFDNRNAGTGKTITPAGTVNDGNGGSNYAVTFLTATGTISPLPITVAAVTDTKIYDGSASSSGAPAITAGALVNGDTVLWTQAFDTRNAGTGKTITPAGAVDDGNGGSNYAVSFLAASGTITPLPITVAAVTDTKMYDGSASSSGTPVITADALAGGDTADWTQAFDDPNAGTGKTLTPAGAVNDGNGGNNYTVTFLPASGTINPLPIAIAADAKTKTYGSPDPDLTYTAVPPLVSGDNFTGALSRVAGENVGSYAIIQGTLSAGANYALTFTGANLSITRLAITVTADAKTKSYGSPDPALTYTVAPPLVSGDSFTGALSRAPGENVGNYAILRGTLSAGTNYTLTFTSTNLTITPVGIAVTAEAKTKTYGSADPALTYTFTPDLIGGDSFTGALARAPGENVGSYAVERGTLSAGANYTITFTSANLTITPLAISVTADNKTKVYGSADPALTYTNSPDLIGGDAFTGALYRAAGENVGDYPIERGTLSAGANYTITFTEARLTITPLPITVTADNKSKIYGSADPELTYTTSPALIGSDVLPGSLERAAGENVGEYAIRQGSLSGGPNYTVTFTGASFTITRLAITVTADAKSKQYGSVDPELTYTAAPPLVSGDSFSGALVREAGEDLGVYAILRGTLSAGPNYTITFTGANFTITRADQTITVTTDAPVRAVYGSSFTVAAISSSGLEVSYSASGGCTNSGPVFTMTSSTENCIVHYNQEGDSTYNPASEVIQIVQAGEPPAVTLHPVSARVYPGQDATFTAAATGSPDPTIQWQVSTDGGVTFNDLEGEISATLTITTPAQSSNRYQYRAVFTNISGTAVTNAATLHLLYHAMYLPKIARNP